jgi:hypothetical protein
LGQKGQKPFRARLTGKHTPMPFQNFPATPPVDESRRGILTINEGGLLGLLGIENHRIEEMRITTTGNLQIEIVGEDMPAGCLPKPVVLLCNVQLNRPGDLSELTPDRRIFAHWEHKPEKLWRLR